MRCEICGATPSKALTCGTCHRVAASLCDGFVCQPRLWMTQPQEPKSCIPLMNGRCECGGLLESAALVASAAQRSEAEPPSRLLHVIWLRGALRREVLENVARWVQQSRASTVHGVLPVIWMDASAREVNRAHLHRSPEDALMRAVGAMLPVEARLDLGSGLSLPCVSVERWLPETTVVEDLRKALLFEAKAGLVQVASDLLRILVLHRHGGCYVDAGDVGPSDRPLTLATVYQQIQSPFCCRMKKFGGASLKPENDLILVNHRHAGARKLMADVETRMLEYYEGRPARRQEELEAALEGELEAIQEAIQRFVHKLGEDAELRAAYRHALSVEGEPMVLKSFFTKAIHKNAASYFAALERGINEATMGPYARWVSKKLDLQDLCGWWEAIRPCFSEGTASKSFYSWKTPGLGVLEATAMDDAPSRGSSPRESSATGSRSAIEHLESQRRVRFRGKTYKYDDEDERDDILDKLRELERLGSDDPTRASELLSNLEGYEA